MVLDEGARHELFLRLEQALGAESAATLMEMLPPVGWADVATKHDLDALEQRMELRFVATKRDLDALEQRMELRFDAVDHGFDALDHRFEAMEHKLLAAFRGELLGAVTAQTNVFAAQTRTLVLANLGAVLSMAALAFGAAKIA
jgi:hypothetical protein